MAITVLQDNSKSHDIHATVTLLMTAPSLEGSFESSTSWRHHPRTRTFHSNKQQSMNQSHSSFPSPPLPPSSRWESAAPASPSPLRPQRASSTEPKSPPQVSSLLQIPSGGVKNQGNVASAVPLSPLIRPSRRASIDHAQSSNSTLMMLPEVAKSVATGGCRETVNHAQILQALAPPPLLLDHDEDDNCSFGSPFSSSSVVDEQDKDVSPDVASSLKQITNNKSTMRLGLFLDSTATTFGVESPMSNSTSRAVAVPLEYDEEECSVTRRSNRPSLDAESENSSSFSSVSTHGSDFQIAAASTAATRRRFFLVAQQTIIGEQSSPSCAADCSYLYSEARRTGSNAIAMEEGSNGKSGQREDQRKKTKAASAA